MKKRFIDFFRFKRNSHGFSLVEVVVSLLVVSIISGSAITFFVKSNQSGDDAISSSKARILADNALATFQFSETNADFINALGIFSNVDNGNTKYEETGGGNVTLQKYNSTSVIYSFIKVDASAKTIFLIGTDGTSVIECLDYNNASNFEAACNSLTPSSLTVNISDYNFNSNLAGCTGSGTLSAYLDSDKKGTVYLELDKIGIVEYAGTYSPLFGDSYPYYEVAEEWENHILYYCKAEDRYYTKHEGEWKKLQLGNFSRSIGVGTKKWPGFMVEGTVSSLPASCTYENWSATSEAIYQAYNNMKDIAVSSATIKVSTDVNYMSSASNTYSNIQMDVTAKAERLLDSEGAVIIEKIFSSADDFNAELKRLNLSETNPDDEGNVYKYSTSYTEDYSYEETVDATETKAYTATISGNAYSKYTISFTIDGTSYSKSNYTTEAAAVEYFKEELAKIDSDYSAPTAGVSEYYVAGTSTKPTIYNQTYIYYKSGSKYKYLKSSGSWSSNTNENTCKRNSSGKTAEQWVQNSSKNLLTKTVTYSATAEVTKVINEDATYTATISGSNARKWTVSFTIGTQNYSYNNLASQEAAKKCFTDELAKLPGTASATTDGSAKYYKSGTDNELTCNGNKIYYVEEGLILNTYYYYTGSTWSEVYRSSKIGNSGKTAEGWVISSSDVVTKSYTCSSSYTYSYTETTTTIIEDIRNYNKTISASYTDKTITTVDSKDNSETKDEYTLESAFITAQTALYGQSGYTAVPAGTYKFSFVRRFKSISLETSDAMPGGTFHFVDESGGSLYDLSFNTEAAYSSALNLLNTTYVSNFNVSGTTYTYKNEPGVLSIITNPTDFTLSFYVSFISLEDTQPVYKIVFENANELNAALAGYSSSDTSQLVGVSPTTEKNGTYTANIDGYKVTINVNYVSMTFDATVKDSKNNEVYALHYEKG